MIGLYFVIELLPQVRHLRLFDGVVLDEASERLLVLYLELK